MAGKASLWMSSCCQIWDGTSLLCLSNVHNDSVWYDKWGKWGNVSTRKMDSTKKMDAPSHFGSCAEKNEVDFVKCWFVWKQASVRPPPRPCWLPFLFPLISLLNFSLLLSMHLLTLTHPCVSGRLFAQRDFSDLENQVRPFWAVLLDCPHHKSHFIGA